MKLVYVAGPLRGDHAANIARAREAVIEMISRGLWPVCPWIIHREEEISDDGALIAHPDLDVQTFLDLDFALIGRMDAMYLLPGWESSEGARAELDHALDVKLPVFSNLDVLLAWSTANL